MGSRHAAKADLGTKSSRAMDSLDRAGRALGIIQETGLPDADAALEVLIPRRLIADPASFSKPSARASPGVGPSLP